jgi:hypothetical protein
MTGYGMNDKILFPAGAGIYFIAKFWPSLNVRSSAFAFDPRTDYSKEDSSSPENNAGTVP